MSTILKSLRKLEDEKSVLEKKINLKELVIQEDKRPKTVEEEAEPPRHWWSGLLLIVGGIAVGVTAVWLMQPASSPAPPAAAPPAPAPQAVASANVEEKKEVPLPGGMQGVRMSSIPDFTERPARNDEGVIIEEDIEPTDPVPGSMASPVTDDIPMLSLPEAVQAAPEEPSAPEPAAGDQIVNALANVPVQTRNSMTPNPELPVIQPVVMEEIPGLKIKGIIFFGENDPANYIFFTLPDSRINRLKVGETVADAKLKAIHPGRALFDYQGRTVELRVGL